HSVRSALAVERPYRLLVTVEKPSVPDLSVLVARICDRLFVWMKVNSDVHCHGWSRRVVLLSEPSFSNSPPRDQLHSIRLDGPNQSSMKKVKFMFCHVPDSFSPIFIRRV